MYVDINDFDLSINLSWWNLKYWENLMHKFYFEIQRSRNFFKLLKTRILDVLVIEVPLYKKNFKFLVGSEKIMLFLSPMTSHDLFWFLITVYMMWTEMWNVNHSFGLVYFKNKTTCLLFYLFLALNVVDNIKVI